MSSVPRIVVFRSDFKDEKKQLAFLREHGAKIVRFLRIINGVAVEIAVEKERTLSKASEVVRIETDERVVRAL